MTFSSIESAMATALHGALANATLVWGSHSSACVFDKDYVDTLGIANARTQARILAPLVPGIAAGDTVTIDSVGYTVQRIETLAAGELILVLGTA